MEKTYSERKSELKRNVFSSCWSTVKGWSVSCANYLPHLYLFNDKQEKIHKLECDSDEDRFEMYYLLIYSYGDAAKTGLFSDKCIRFAEKVKEVMAR